MNGFTLSIKEREFVYLKCSACHVMVISDNAVGSVIKGGSGSLGRICHLELKLTTVDDRQGNIKSTYHWQFRAQTVRFRDSETIACSPAQRRKQLTEPAHHQNFA